MMSATLKIRGGVDRDAYGKKAGKGPLVQWEMSATLGVTQDQTLFVFTGADMLKILAIHEADGQDMTVQEELAYSLSSGGGKAGQGYPCIVMTNDGDGEDFDNADREEIL